MKNKYWFKRKRFGYGFVPYTKEGWFVIISYLIMIAIVSIFAGINEELMTDIYWLIYTCFILILTGIVVFISFRKSPKAKWRWGWKDGDDPEFDA